MLKKRRELGFKEPLWKRRYTIAFYGFLTHFLLSFHRMSMSIAIVAMVKISDHENQTVLNESYSLTEAPDEASQDQPIHKFNWNPEIQGFILASSFLGFGLSSIAAGILAERFGPKLVLLFGVFVSSFTTTITPLAAIVGPYFVIFVQCVRGLAQGCMLPAANVLSANWFPRLERGLLTGFSVSGLWFGVLMGAILSGLICDNISVGGWPSVFYIFGGFGIFVSLLQVFFLTDVPTDDSRISSAELKYILENQENRMKKTRPPVPWKKMFRSLPTYALIFAKFGQTWTNVHFFSVHATFLATVLHYPATEIGALISGPNALSVVVSVLMSYLSSFVQTKNYLTINKIRKLWHLSVSLIYSSCLALLIFTNAENTVTIVCSIVAIASNGFFSSGIAVVPLDMTPTFAGSLTGLASTVGTFAGFILNVIRGSLTKGEQTLKQWNKFFVISIVVVMGTALFFCFFGSAEIQSYNSPRKDSSSKANGETKNDSKLDALTDNTECTTHL